MKEHIITALTNLIKIKSIVTLALTAAFVVMALRGDVTPEQFIPIFTTIVGFYFGTQKVKETSVPEAEEPEREEKSDAVWEG